MTQPKIRFAVTGLNHGHIYNQTDCMLNTGAEHVGCVLNTLADAGILDDTIIMVSSDHGESLGELNVWDDHQTADHITCRVPLIVHWPGLTDQPWVDSSLHYQYDWVSTMIEAVCVALETICQLPD